MSHLNVMQYVSRYCDVAVKNNMTKSMWVPHNMIDFFCYTY